MRGLYEIASPFVLKYKECPSNEEMKQLIAASDWTPAQRQKITDETVDLLWGDCETYQTLYDPVWMTEQVEAFYRYQTLMKGVRETVSFVKLNSENFTIENCKEMADKIQNMFDKKTTVDFDSDSENFSDNDADLDDVDCLFGDDFERFSTGVKFLDNVSGGGYWPGAFWVFVGAPKAGKSRWLQDLAVRAHNLNYDVCYVGLEMQKTIITRRLASNLYNININDLDIKNKDIDKQKYVQIFKNYKSIHNLTAKIHVSKYPTSTLTVDELEKNLLKQEKIYSNKLGKEFHYKIIFIDYLNILANKINNNTENTYIKIKQISENLCAVAQRNGWCIVSATQSKQSCWGLETIDMSACSESSCLQATCDELFGIISTSEMAKQHEQYLKILLNRVGGCQDFKQKFAINEKYGRLEQSSESMIFDNGSDLLKTDDDKQQKKQFRKALKDKKEGDKSDLNNTSTTDNIDTLFSDMKNFKIN
ncbi:hypothetical protein LPYR103PRE_23450 [Segatella asaccharophila]